MDNTIIIEVKEHYGQEHFYIVSEHKEYIQQLTGHLTVTRKDINSLKALGFNFKINQPIKI